MRLVLDTDVIIAGMRSPRGAAAKIIRLIDEGHAILLLSVTLALEYEAICSRAEHRLAAGLSKAEVDIFLDGLVSLAEPVIPQFRWRPQLHDPADEMVLEAAVNGRADAIVTFNRRDYGNAPGKFGIQLYNPGETLRRIAT